MKKIIFLTAIAFLTLNSCRKEETTLAKDQTSVQSQLKTNASSSQTQTNVSSSGGAVTYSDVFKEDRTGISFFNPCTNELITVQSGYLLFDFHGVINGINSTFIVHTNVQGVKTVGESGRQYTVSGSWNGQTSYFSNGVFTTKLEIFYRWITAGSDNTLIRKETFYIKVDADGNVTVLKDETHEIYCQ